MGCFNSFNLEQNPFLNKEEQALKAIKSCDLQTLGYYLSLFLDAKVTEIYCMKLMNFQQQLSDLEKNYLNNEFVAVRQEKIKTREGNINFHMQHILNQVKLSDLLIKKLSDQVHNTKKMYNEKRLDWNMTMGRILQNGCKPKIISQIVEEKMGNKRLDEDKMKAKQEQCSQKIEQILSEVDLQPEQRKNTVLTQINQLNQIIKNYKNEVEKLKQQKNKLIEKNKQLVGDKNIALSEWERKMQKLEMKIVEQKNKNDGLQKQNKNLKQSIDGLVTEKQKILSQIYGNKSFDSITRPDIINQQEGKQNKEEFQNINVKQQMKQMVNTSTQTSNQQQNNLKVDRSPSIEFKKFTHSVILNNVSRGFHGSKNYKQIVDEIFGPIKILSSKTLFIFDKIRPNNVNQYINKQKNLLLLVQLNNGSILGAFSRFGFKESPQNLKENICFIFCIHSPKQYYKLQLKEQNMAKYSAKLDNNYLKIGDNELRITCGKDEGLCGVGGNPSIFTNKDRKISAYQFLNMKQQKFEIVNYEVQELDLDYPEELLQKSKNVQAQSFIEA